VIDHRDGRIVNANMADTWSRSTPTCPSWTPPSSTARSRRPTRSASRVGRAGHGRHPARDRQRGVQRHRKTADRPADHPGQAAVTRDCCGRAPAVIAAGARRGQRCGRAVSHGWISSAAGLLARVFIAARHGGLLSDPNPSSYVPLPARVELAAVDHEVLAFWREHDVFARSVSRTTAVQSGCFYEGPPTANGKPGTHHVEARGLPRTSSLRFQND